MTVMLLASSGILLGACATDRNFATLTSGACKSFPAPKYQIKGRTSYDQKWADQTTEAGVAGCNWHRPATRPASLDAKPKPAPLPAADDKPRTFRERWFDKFKRHRKAA